MWTNSSQASISIHALREEGDYNPFVHTCFFGYFYPRPPRGGRHADSVPGADCANISIHALREEGDPTSISGPTLHQVISIHALREEGDRNSYMFTRFLRDFYPRPPRGGRPHDVVFVGECNFISIHALREEGDSS